jgi:hypothetical protein
MVMDGLICEYRNSMYSDERVMKKLEQKLKVENEKGEGEGRG